VATQRRQISGDEFWKLWEIGVLGEKVELLDGWIVFGRFPFAFSAEAVAHAREHGIELTKPESAERVGYRLASMGTPGPTPEDSRTLAALLAWEVLERVLLMLVEEGHVTLSTAVSWLAEPDEALDGMSPAQWVELERDLERLLIVARRDAARLGQ
jgi:hypothetical protein